MNTMQSRKQKPSRILLLMAIILASVLTSCTDKSDNPSPTPPPPADVADYAVLVYGHGSLEPSLDFEILKNIYDCYGADPASYDKVKVAVQYKWGKRKDMGLSLGLHHLSHQTRPTPEEKEYVQKYDSQLARIVVDPTLKGKDYGKDDICLGPQQLLDAPFYGEMGGEVSHPDSLTSFINWAVEACPAKHYMLILSSHGSGFRLGPDDHFLFLAANQGGDDEDEALTRGLVPDTNTGNSMSIFELRAALEKAKARMDVVYFDACLMNMPEVEYELRDLTDYIIASTFPVPGIGGSYTVLIDQLAKEQPIETALANFAKANGESWDKADDAYNVETNFDQSVIRPRDMDAYAAKVNEFTTLLVDAYTNGGDEVRKGIDKCTASAIKVENFDPYYEAISYFAMLAMELPQYFDKCFVELKEAYQKCLVYRFTSPGLEKLGFQMGTSTLIAHEDTYELYLWERSVEGVWTVADSYVDKNISSLYQRLEWDRATGWSRWLLLNKQKPIPISYLEPRIKEGDAIKFDEE